MTRGVLAVRTLTCVAVTLVVAAGVVPAHAQKAPPVSHTAVTDQMLSNAAADAKNWLSYGKDYSNTRYASSRKITTQNVGTLIPRWVYQTGGPIGSFETTPLVVDGVMYLTTPFNHAIALDARTGKQVWRFWSIPETGWEGKWSPTTPEGEKLNRDLNKEQADFAKYKDSWQRGGGSTWMTPAVDPATDTIFIVVGNPSPDLDGSIRPGDNLYTESMVALDVKTGKYKWHYQYVPHDVWDLDAVSPAVLFETMADGKRVKAVGHAGKTGWFYIHDRATGKLIRKSQAFVPQENMFAQPTAAGVRMLPGANGGAEWSPVAYSPDTRMVYVLGLHQPMNYITHSTPFDRGKLWLGSAFVAIPGEEQSGTFTAIDVNTGKIAWQNKLPDPLIGGALATAGGVVFTGGDGTGNFYAFDAKTGKALWRFQCGAGGT